MAENDLTQARALIKECQKIKNPYLDLGNCGITDLNDLPELFECTHLETLILSNNWWDVNKRKWIQSSNTGPKNKIDSITAEVSNLKTLMTLFLGGEWDNEWIISDISFLEKLTGLQSLDLRSNQISDYSFLEKLTGLQSLDLRYNKISDISFLEKLTGLQSLDLRSNQISDISFLEKLTGLQSLDLRENKISDISFLEKLTGLQSLDLRENKIKNIPLSIFQLGMEIFLEYYGIGLNLDDNPIESPPMEILKQGLQSGLDWFEATKIKLNEIKIMLIGDPKAGKTSLLRRLKDNTFDENEVQTDGVNIEDIQFGECETFKKQKALHELTGHFWDFGGQEIMNATHQFS